MTADTPDVGLTEQEREALRTSGSWPNVGRDIFVAVERIVAARVAAERERADTAAADAWDEGKAAGLLWWKTQWGMPGPVNPYRAALGDTPPGGAA